MTNCAKLGQFPSLHLQDPADEERDTGCGPRPVRSLLAQRAVEVVDFAVDKGAVRQGAPAVVRFLAQITTRFGIGPVKVHVPRSCMTTPGQPANLDAKRPLIAIITIPKLPNSNCRAPGQDRSRPKEMQMIDGLSPKPWEVEGGPKTGLVGAILPAVELDRHFNFNESICCRFAAGAVAGDKRLKFQLRLAG